MAEPTGTGPLTLRRSPLEHLKDTMRAASVSGARGVSLTEWPFLTMVDMRVAPGSAAAVRIEQALGTPLPLRCGDTTASGPHAVMWLGPDEWLVLSQEDGAELTHRLHEALGGDAGSVVDVSANRTTLELRGPAARDVLEKGCPLDLHPRSFGPGQAVSTTVGPVPVVLWQVDGAPAYRLLPRASFADYLARWLLDAMREYGHEAEAPLRS
ncbi:sarcosine oxidase subunit gamma [Streptomyces sp. RK75]|uniref:sarcosine oxidase subunit gamma n=1 Tax=Streptomyces sp. RK75 TaxID=2824895 RepID=UPI001B392B1E|nr:sarcosine oxidase subunit gamma family protein [Streptomyces sp. RK75]MBQ0862225.1 sarcosine oxidase subunit gamma [Streptomyces sp. RK75]